MRCSAQRSATQATRLPSRSASQSAYGRLFDIVKPPPAAWIDREWHHGLGVMGDDLVAAGYTLLVLALWQRLLG